MEGRGPECEGLEGRSWKSWCRRIDFYRLRVIRGSSYWIFILINHDRRTDVTWPSQEQASVHDR